MPRPADKPNHIALSQTTQSLIVRQTSNTQEAARLRFDLERTRFPMPGSESLNVKSMAPHTAVVGATGAGKTNMQKAMLNAVLPCANEFGGLRYRAVVYDPKRELYPYLCDTGIPESQIIVTHPFDARSSAWDLAADFNEPAQIEELALMIVPENSEKHGKDSSFFENTARIIVQDVIEGLIKNRKQNWDLRDVVIVLSNLDYLKAILNLTHNGRESWELFFRSLDTGRDTRLAMDIIATLRSYVRPFNSLAALWHQADTKFSISQWSTGSGLLLLGADPKRKRTMERVNRLLVHRISQTLLSRKTENPVDLTWFFMDEVREAGRLDGLRQLLNEGRSKGVRVVLGFQDIEGLYSLYDKNEAEEMVGLCANRIILHLDNPGTRTWASEFIGESEEEIPEVSKTVGKEESTTTTYKIAMRVNALPIQFHDLPLASPADGVHGWFAFPGHRNKFWIDPADMQRVLAPGNCSILPETKIERSPNSQRLFPWKDEDLFGIEIDLEPASAQPASRRRKKGLVMPHFRTGSTAVDEIEG